MYGLPTGTKTVAIVERWPLVEVRMYMFNKIIQMDNLKNCLCFSQNKILVVQDWMSQGIVCYPIQPNQNLEWTWHSSMIVFLHRGSHQKTGHHVVTMIFNLTTLKTHPKSRPKKSLASSISPNWGKFCSVCKAPGKVMLKPHLFKVWIMLSTR